MASHGAASSAQDAEAVQRGAAELRTGAMHAPLQLQAACALQEPTSTAKVKWGWAASSAGAGAAGSGGPSAGALPAALLGQPAAQRSGAPSSAAARADMAPVRSSGVLSLFLGDPYLG